MSDENQRLPESLAKQVLARAAQLDASDRAGVSIDELRTAAIEAGISTTALERALSEVATPATQAAEASSVRAKPRRYTRVLMLAAAAVATIMVVFILRMAVPSPIEVERIEIPTETEPSR